MNHFDPSVENVETILKLFALFEHGVETILKLFVEKLQYACFCTARGNVKYRTRPDEFTEERSDPRRDSPLNHSNPSVEFVETILKLFANVEHGIESGLKLFAMLERGIETKLKLFAILEEFGTRCVHASLGALRASVNSLVRIR
ncbi:MAG: hypothetical protein IKP09_02265 [Lentisphaeria bacterium]|nr:hypothetical protein [Lentisphaeria bacterium]